MADLSDEQLDAIRLEASARQRGATDTVRAIMRAAIAADRALNAAPVAYRTADHALGHAIESVLEAIRREGAAHSVGAEGLPPMPPGDDLAAKLAAFEAWNQDRYRDTMDIAIARGAFVAGWMALASRPAVDADGPWVVVDRNNADAVVGGPFVHEETAAYHRSTLEMNASDKRNERWNLWVVRQAARHPAQREGT